MFQCLRLQMAQCVEIKLNPAAAAGTEGFSKFEDVVLGGQTTDGLDATNDLSYLILESTRALQITVPEPCIRIHANTPDRFLHYVAEVIKDGKGFPKLLNDEMVIPFYLANGATMKEALDWNISGCCENRLINRETNVTGNGGINYGSAVEMTFRNGKLKVLKDIQFGVQTGDPRKWTSYEDVWKAFCRQLEHLARHALIQQHVALRLKPAYFAAPATSMLHDLAIAECRDLHTHGEYFPGALDHSCFEAIGKGTAIDSLAAVKHLIFDWDLASDVTEECASLCPTGALHMFGQEMTVDQVLDEVEQDSSFYRESGGGVTLSGGECLLQPDFCAAPLAGAHERGFTTAIETAGNVPWAFMEKVLPHVDTVLHDHKLTDPKRHKKWCGADNSRILANFKKAYETFPDKTFIARTPVIPGVNDDEEHIRAVLEFIRSHKNVVDYELLPYFRFGESKYGFLGRVYELEDFEPPTPESLARLQAIIDEAFGRSGTPARA